MTKEFEKKILDYMDGNFLAEIGALQDSPQEREIDVKLSLQEWMHLRIILYKEYTNTEDEKIKNMMEKILDIMTARSFQSNAHLKEEEIRIIQEILNKNIENDQERIDLYKRISRKISLL